MSNRRSSVRALALLLGLGVQVAAQQQLLELEGPGPLCGLGDIDGDGRADLALLASAAGNGTVRVVSGASQLTLFTLTGDAPGIGFGSALAAAGDVDGDGVPDLIVGAPLADGNGADAGFVRVVSGADGSALLTVTGTAPDARLGVRVAGIGDANGDGVPDLAATAAHFFVFPDNARVLLLSGADGSLLQEWGDDPDIAMLGLSICGPGDVNADGFADLAACGYLGWARVYSGADGSRLQLITGAGAIHEVAPGGDLDGDGRPDLAVLDNWLGPGTGRVFSGATGSQLLAVGPPSTSTEGQSFACLGDVDGDRVPDYVLGSNPFPAEIDGRATVYSGATGAIDFTCQQFVSTGESGIHPTFGSLVRALGDVDGDGVSEIGSASNGSWLVHSGRESLFTQLPIGDLAFTPGLLAGVGTLQPDSDVALWSTQLAASSPSFLVVGVATLGLPLKGGVLVPVPALLLGPFATNAAGALVLHGRWPSGVPSTFSTWFQTWSHDAGLPQGWRCTTAVRATTP